MGALRTNTICKIENRVVELSTTEMAAGKIGKDTTRSRKLRVQLLNAYWTLKYVFDDADVRVINTFITGL